MGSTRYKKEIEIFIRLDYYISVSIISLLINSEAGSITFNSFIIVLVFGGVLSAEDAVVIIIWILYLSVIPVFLVYLIVLVLCAAVVRWNLIVYYY